MLRFLPNCGLNVCSSSSNFLSPILDLVTQNPDGEGPSQCVQLGKPTIDNIQQAQIFHQNTQTIVSRLCSCATTKLIGWSKAGMPFSGALA